MKNGLHVAIIMDGNGRWAAQRGLPREVGHSAGVTALRRVVAEAPGLGVSTLTVFAMSSDNFNRPPSEVAGLLGLVRHYLAYDLTGLVEAGVRVSFIGRRNRLLDGMAEEMARAEERTREGALLHLRVAVDYASRDAMLDAMTVLGDGTASREAFAALLAAPMPPRDVDLLIRTSGEKRLSDFLLWESAYAELCFVEKHWPDFGGEDLAAAVADFNGRERRFGRVPARAA